MESSVDFLYFHCFILFFPRLSQAGSPFLSTTPGQLPDTAPGLLPATAPRHSGTLPGTSYSPEPCISGMNTRPFPSSAAVTALAVSFASLQNAS